MSGTNTGARIKAELLRELAFGAATSTLTQLGADVGFTLKALRFNNQFDVDMYVSLYGGIVTTRVAAGSSFTFDLQANNMCMNRGDAILTSYTSDMGAPGSGIFSVEAYYT